LEKVKTNNYTYYTAYRTNKLIICNIIRI